MRSLIVAFAVLHVSASAEAALSLSWQDCVREVKQGNAELRAAVDTAAATKFQSHTAWQGFLPKVSANLGYTQANSQASGRPSSPATSTYSAGLSVTQNLFSGFQDLALIRQGRANSELAEASLDATKAKISYDLKISFEGLSHAQNLVRLTENIIKRREENLRLVELRFESGRENKGSLLLSTAYLARARLENIQAENQLRLAHVQLAKVLGRDPSESIVLKDRIPVAEPGETPDFALLAQRTPDHRQAVARADSAAEGLVLARSSFFPTLNFNGQVGRSGVSFFPNDRSWSAGISLSLPLFAGGKNYFSTRAAGATLSAAEMNRENVDRTLLASLRQSWFAFVESVERLNVDTLFLQAANTRAEIARRKYDNGLISFDDWDKIENDLISYEKGRLQSERDRVVSEAAWEQIQGKGVIP